MNLTLSKKMNKPKELWKTLKSMSLPSKAVSALNICLKDKNQIVFDDTKNSSTFKTWYLNYLLHQLSLLNLKSHLTMITLSLRT